MIINTKYKIKTEHGYERFDGITTVNKEAVHIIDKKNMNSLTCAAYHAIKVDGKFVNAISLPADKFDVRPAGNLKLFDIINTESHEYTTNGIQSHNCKFIGSGGTLIDGETIARLVADIPVYETDDGFMRVYKAPEAAKRYVVIADSAEGTGNDESAITIIDVVVKPMKVVLTYANNKIKPIDFAQLIHTLGRRYNDAYLLVESNSIGNLVCNELWNKFENEGLLTTDDKGNIIFSGAKYGIRTTSKTKRTGAQLVKMLVESGDIDVSDERIIEQMQTFVRVGITNSYAGAPGKKDDLMMTLLIFAWFSGTDFFKDDSGIDVIDDLTDIDPDDEDFIPAVYCNF